MTVRDIAVAFGIDVDQKSVNTAESTIKNIKSIATKALGAIAIGFSFSALNSIAEEFNGINDQIRGATRELGDQEEIQQRILQAANDTKQSYGDMAGYVTQLVKMDQNLFGDVETATSFATQSTKALAAAGRSSSEISAAQSQLNRVFAQGELNASSFTRILRSYPELINTMAEGLNVTQDELAAMADAGQLSSETIVSAFSNASDKINSDFDELDYSISDAVTNIRNSWGLFVDQLWVGSGITNGVGKMMVRAFNGFLDVLKKLQPYIERVIRFLLSGVSRAMDLISRVGSFIGRLVDRIGGVENALKLIVTIAGAIWLALNAGKIINFLKTIGTLMGGINLKMLAIIAVIVLIALIVEDFINFLQGNDSVIGAIFDKAGIGADNVREAIFKAWNKVKEFLLNAWDFIKTAAGMFADTVKGFFERHGESIRANFERAWGIIKTFLNGVWTFISQLASTLFGDTEESIDGSTMSTKDKILAVWQAILDALSAIWDALYEVGSAIFNAIATVIETVFGWIQTFWNAWGSTILAWFKTLWDTLGRILGDFLDIIKGVANFISSVFTGDWEGAWEAIKQIFTSIWDAIVAFIGAIWETIKMLFSMALAALQAIWEAIWGAISNFFQGIWNGIVSFVTGIWDTITSVISGAITGAYNIIVSILTAIQSFFSSIFSSIADFVSSTFSNILSGITGTVSSIKDAIVNGLNAAIDWIKGLPSQAVQWGADIISGIADGIKGAISKVTDAVSGVADKIKSFLHFSVPDEGPLTDFQSWMPDFMSGLAEGIGDSEDTLLDKVKGVASGISTIMKGATANAATAANGAVSNTSNNTNITQNNTFNNSYSGGDVQTQKNVSKGMNKSAQDATDYLAKGLAYAR